VASPAQHGDVALVVVEGIPVNMVSLGAFSPASLAVGGTKPSKRPCSARALIGCIPQPCVVRGTTPLSFRYVFGRLFVSRLGSGA